ncbi:MAG: tRNA (N(6)-L-threonylcarbamoyladenosine(37)-C(2))-methylthiotransferase MtaB, partial [Peptoniphilaceae bacterium]|nr:tRNA (N(6)-L-threonylcarbamoyladenosine(37)-C(2))-methylthiotransferase MtaB [Peptoniphilaceae bacterium]MDY5766647.1 tRNA (N(6)-L-threonylcarbamoyladenosine(37)-C(2))-methylthiotransferase MtaB [Peptoniphilaceae bacterium]
MKKVAFHTLGCKVNQYETEAMEEIFLHRGYEAGTEEDCDVYVVNTCTVTHMSDAKSRRRIRRVKNHNPDAVVCVVGCYSQVSPEEVGKIPDVDILMGTKDRAELPLLVDRFLQKRERIVHIANLEEQRTFDELSIETELETTRAVIKIQEGCDMYCTYCIIPYARGHIASRSLNSILSEAKR